MLKPGWKRELTFLSFSFYYVLPVFIACKYIQISKIFGLALQFQRKRTVLGFAQSANFFKKKLKIYLAEVERTKKT